jgi:hypothetical protein
LGSKEKGYLGGVIKEVEEIISLPSIQTALGKPPIDSKVDGFACMNKSSSNGPITEGEYFSSGTLGPKT